MSWPLGKASWGCFRSNASKVFIAATDDSTSKFTGRALLAEEAEGQGLNGGSYSMAIILSQSIQDVKKGLAEICLESPCAPSLLEGLRCSSPSMNSPVAGDTWRGTRIGISRICLNNSLRSLVFQGGDPVRSSYTKTPRDHQSIMNPPLNPSTSGATYMALPQGETGSSKGTVTFSLASPKSTSFTYPRASSITFSGFKSR
mmetsp:Transcript_68169/g.137126  ORF Transcript_68169/g.137126 Transcript_68169/m.137126 type:complete len:201 (-) Transcript_68169:374-976(-)